MANVIFGNARYVPAKKNYKVVNDVYIGVFFDGTSNNRKNIEGRRKNSKLMNSKISDNDGSNTSYGNDNTNVDRLEKAYLNDPNCHYYSVYVEGIGTKNPDENDDGTLDYYGDFTRGQAYGTGETGLFEKVEKGCFDIVQKLQLEEENSISTLYLDVFGFSRGATAARIFVNELYKKKIVGKEDSYNLGYLGKAFQKLDYKQKPIRIKIRLLGLYDTVSSYGKNVFDDVDVDNVPLKIPTVGFTVHLTAEDEHRVNFPLTNIDSAGANSIELSLPGVHSDIGGGYKTGTETVSLTESETKIASEKKYVLEQKWFSLNQLESPSTSPNKLIGTKNLSNEYSYVILHLMAEFGKRKYKIPWNYDAFLNNENFYKIPKDLLDVKKRIDLYAFEKKSKLQFYTAKEIESKRQKVWHDQKAVDAFNTMVGEHYMLEKLRKNYLHCSASLDGIGMEPIQDNRNNIIWKRKIIQG
ncbi:T6SS phospholipase effector Tle1-like catalytic domain-containing protein [Flavobacterium hercynium]|uniref:T6SS Phospholipase effector Tle1-like catalytic domain-containing protein n=1 Tax=Flavobacterium hercynium TaxID=387094 RepID=A0A226GZ83_9FLAO|nr:DUF2235 domain-containing protein [Flavobacterium hercynium]OXA87292.1 hypothetical protein B0A66_16910 [Flavobacterium hercynium]SMP19740.1 Uncharacterized alpha/beta hydrolase domain [Flavobacterium hercynium]